MNIGLLGFGVVGRGVYDILAGRDDIRVRTVLCRRDLGALTCAATRDMQDILDDPGIDTVVEVMGGLEPAYAYVSAALAAGVIPFILVDFAKIIIAGNLGPVIRRSLEKAQVLQ